MPPHVRLLQLATAIWPSPVIYAAAKFGLADHFRDGPLSLAQLSKQSGVTARPLGNLVIALSHIGILTRGADNTFSLSSIGRALQTGAVGSARAAILLMSCEQAAARNIVSARRAAASKQLTQTTPLIDYLGASLHMSFRDYYDRYFFPFYHARNPLLTPEQLRYQMSLESIAPYLRRTEKLAMMTNNDDLILTPEEVAFLQDVFGPRATIWPTGGHCGNLQQKDVVAFIVSYFKD